MPHASIRFTSLPGNHAWIVNVRGGTRSRWEVCDTFDEALATCRRLWEYTVREDQDTFELMLMAFQGRLPDQERN